MNFLLLDRSTPDLDGIRTARRFREALPSAKTRIVLMPGDWEVAQQARPAAFRELDCVIRKLFDTAALLSLLSEEFHARSPQYPSSGVEKAALPPER